MGIKEREAYLREFSKKTANTLYKVRISKGFVDASFGEGFLVEVWDYRTKKLVYGEAFKDLERARRRQKEIQSDLDSMTVERFHHSYLSRTR